MTETTVRFRRLHRLVVSWLNVALVGTAPILAQTPDSGLVATLDSTVIAEMSGGNIPGSAIAIVQQDGVAYMKGYGVRDVETEDPMSPDVLFNAASVSKMFTAAALLSLAHDGDLDLDAPIGRYLTYLPTGLARLTTRALLSHTAGLRDGGGRGGRADPQALNELCRTRDDSSAFHGIEEAWSYTNVGYALAGCVAASVSDMPYEAVVREHVFAPLGMERSTFRPLVAMTYPMALGHGVVDDRATVIRPYPSYPATSPAGSLITSARELARFATALVNGGRVDGRQVLPSEVVEALLTSRVRATDMGDGPMEYGYGMFSWRWRGLEFAGHIGANPGFGAEVIAVPEHRVAVIVLTNRTFAYLDDAKEVALSRLLPLRPEVATVSPSDELRDVEPWVGAYGFGDPRYEIELRDGQLWFLSGTEERAMEQVRTDVFRIADPPGLQPFSSFTIVGVRDDDGRLRGIQYGWRAYPRLE